jgi:hypothetical protein
MIFPCLLARVFLAGSLEEKMVGDLLIFLIAESWLEEGFGEAFLGFLVEAKVFILTYLLQKEEWNLW